MRIYFNRPGLRAVVGGIISIADGLIAVVTLGIVSTTLALSFYTWALRRDHRRATARTRCGKTRNS